MKFPLRFWSKCEWKFHWNQFINEQCRIESPSVIQFIQPKWRVCLRLRSSTGASICKQFESQRSSDAGPISGCESDQSETKGWLQHGRRRLFTSAYYNRTVHFTITEYAGFNVSPDSSHFRSTPHQTIGIALRNYLHSFILEQIHLFAPFGVILQLDGLCFFCIIFTGPAFSSIAQIMWPNSSKPFTSKCRLIFIC